VKSVDEEPEDNAIPGHRNFLIYTDESGTNGARYFGFGSLWMPWERRGDFTGLIGALRAKHRYDDEIKWTNITRRSQAFYCELVREFFERSWLMFHCIIVRVGYIDMSHHDDRDEAMQKFFAMLIKAKIKFFTNGARNKAYHVRVDPLPSRYKKADEKAHKIVAAQLKNELGTVPLKSLFTRDSKTAPGIQLGDLLLGATLSALQEKATSEPKLKVRAVIAEHLGWDDLAADTNLTEWKFNIWRFYDPKGKLPREAKTRKVDLKVPMPKWKGR
jgi:hypothetical protein